MTNKDIWEIALQQSAYDCNCRTEDFLSERNVITVSQKDERARKYLPLPFECDLVSYGNNIVAQVSERVAKAVSSFINSYPPYRCFETPNLHILDEKLKPYGLKVCFQAEYFLPDVTQLKALLCAYETRLLFPNDFSTLYVEEWSNALCKERQALDKLCVGAYDNGRLVGLAGCSADCEEMYQIGVDVLPAYRKQGIASALTSRLACEILRMGKVPFYCAAWSNVRSVRNAIKCGFRPAWVELTARDISFVDQMNGKKKDYEQILNYVP